MRRIIIDFRISANHRDAARPSTRSSRVIEMNIMGRVAPETDLLDNFILFVGIMGNAKALTALTIVLRAVADTDG